MPAPRTSSRRARSSSTVVPTQERCAIASIPYSRLISRVISIVRSRVEPPAPYVTDTNAGPSSRSSDRVPRSLSMPSSSFGGKNSNEKHGRRSSSIWSIRMRKG